MPTITAHKGTKPGDSKTFDLDPEMMLSAVRTRLTNDGFLAADTSSMQSRFIAVHSESSNLQDALVNKSVENLVPLKGVLQAGKELLTTNIAATTKPDLIGIGTDWFFNRYLGVTIFLNNGDPEGAKQNTAIKAFKPLMLTNVKPTSDKVVGIYDNVCVVVEGSIVGFTLSSWAAAGFQMYIGQDQGDPIVNGDLNQTTGNSYNRYLSGLILRYSTKTQTIQIVGADTADVSPGNTIRFQKVTFRTRRISSYSQGGTTYESHAMPPPLGSVPRTAMATHGMAVDALGNQRALANAEQIGTVPGDSIKPGGPIAGPPSNQQWGQPITINDIDPWEQALGEVVVYFFVFKSWEQANQVINGYNAPDPNLWR